ncbi:MAG: hypothetical protein MZU84_05830 [Sphingobacterium sp.]|nr:hypothetical protein [Sphingobacterium sp.]
MFWGLAMAASSAVYVVVSLLTGRGRKAFDMDKMLHRGAYLIKEEYAVVDRRPGQGLEGPGHGPGVHPLGQGHLRRDLRLDGELGGRLRRRDGPQPDPRGLDRGLARLLEDVHDDHAGDLGLRHRLVLGRRDHQPEGDDRDAQGHEARPRRPGLRREERGLTGWTTGASLPTAASSSSTTSAPPPPGSTTSRTAATSRRSRQAAAGSPTTGPRSTAGSPATASTTCRPTGPGSTSTSRTGTAGETWSLTWQPVGREPGAAYRVAHGFGYTRAEAEVEGIASSVVFFVPVDDDREIWRATLRNASGRPRRLAVVGYVEFALGHALVDLINQCDDQHFNRVRFDRELGALFATKTYWVTETRGTQQQENKEWDRWAYFTVNRPVAGYETVRERFIGPFRERVGPGRARRRACRRRTWIAATRSGRSRSSSSSAPGSRRRSSSRSGSSPRPNSSGRNKSVLGRFRTRRRGRRGLGAGQGRSGTGSWAMPGPRRRTPRPTSSSTIGSPTRPRSPSTSGGWPASITGASAGASATATRPRTRSPSSSPIRPRPGPGSGCWPAR